MHRAARFFVAFGLVTVAIWLGLYAHFQARGVDLFEATILVNLMHAVTERRDLLPALGSYALTRFIIVTVALTLWPIFSGQRVDQRLRWGVGAWALASLLQATITGKTYFS